ncbi:O-antigen ligase [Nocardioides sp. zg-DK7169]|uniref:O-antigen ligase family protein n=1 Tax=Nocardioides sp. zg-DK7169 TaxID=2736600 RepID=UPI001552E163|nr:hypothetical protein [Nocardioides sp. zg-DK7169]NPC97960.1 hypothetical protein [Nocardioides sp. zg-DK7169]
MSRPSPTPARTRAPSSAPSPVLSPDAADLPAWPVVVLFAGLPLWWVSGVLDLVWVPAAVVMAMLLGRADTVRAPRGLGVWLLFLAWCAASAIMVTTASDLLGFAYRLALYLAGTVLLVYVYNARHRLTDRVVCGCLTLWWVYTVVGGYLGLLMPAAVLRTPLARLLPDSLLGNELVSHMVVRRLSQFNPDSFLQVAPRPSAPFLYTNNWGNVYSLLLPFVIVHLWQVRGERRFWLLLAVLPASAVPALLTLNRGMFLGVGLAAAYVGLRALLARHLPTIAVLVALGVGAVALFHALPVEERQGDRLSTSATTSTDDRAALYVQALELVPESPLFGHGTPVPTLGEAGVPVGTQGQVWMVLVSHGPVATVCFLGWFALAFLGTVRRRDPVGLACSTALLVGSVELFFYGALPYGLPLLMLAAALGLRGADAAPPPDPRPAAGRPRRLVPSNEPERA